MKLMVRTRLLHWGLSGQEPKTLSLSLMGLVPTFFSFFFFSFLFSIDYRDLNASLACGLMGLDSKVFSPARPGGTRTRVPALNRSVQHHWTTTSMAVSWPAESPRHGAAWEGFPGLEASHKQRGVPQGPQKAGLITAYVSEPPPQGVPPDDFPSLFLPAGPLAAMVALTAFPALAPNRCVGLCRGSGGQPFFPLNFFPFFS